MPRLKPAELADIDYFEPDARRVFPGAGLSTLSRKIINDHEKEAIRFSGFTDFYMPSYMQDDDRNSVFPQKAKWPVHIASWELDDVIHTSIEPANGVSACQAGTCPLCKMDEDLFLSQYGHNDSLLILTPEAKTACDHAAKNNPSIKKDRLFFEGVIGDAADWAMEKSGEYDHLR